MPKRLAPVLALLAAATAASDAVAQPPPSFQAKCAEVRAAIARLPQSDDLVTIAIEGELRGVQSDGALAYLGLCGPPDPRVLCVTYSTGGRKAGERVVVTGTFTPRDPDYVLLDPCLPNPQDE